MLLAFLSFIVGLALLVLVFSVLFSRKNDKNLNIYSLLILASAGIQRFLQGIEEFKLIDSFKNPFVDNFLHQFFMLVFAYLFFDNLLFKKTPVKKVILHLVFPTLFVLVYSLFNLNPGLIKLVFFLFSSLYVLLPGLLIWKFIYKRKNYKELIHFQTIKNWTYFTFGIYFSFYLIFNYVFVNNPQTIGTGYFIQFYQITALIWLFMIIYILKNPVILYGQQLLLKNISTSSKEELVVWRSIKLDPTEAEDLELEKKVKSKVDEIIFAIKKYEEKLLQDLVEVPTLKELAFELDYPQSHLKYVFNYYSFCSFSEYQNNLKIKYALKLIKAGYLDTRTIDSLATRCLFANRRTFYRNFNKWVGFTPTEYLAQISSASF
jgi:AraC-like DNA-binding protein|uniref:helix-turn-helix domain-containing protein n=2 Tax=Algoriphagus sp. TaxID=1872435 RepID=UPI0040482DD7